MSRRVTGYRARAPLRLGLAGGGTDLSPFCDQFTGAVLNATIGRYAYAHLTERNDSCVHFIANDLGLEDVLEARNDLPTDNGLALHRAVYNRMVSSYLNGAVPAITISSTVDAPPGSGLGSSSTLVVALVENASIWVWPAAGKISTRRLLAASTSSSSWRRNGSSSIRFGFATPT
jgi:D-glycero-alpha-D-manno-heptose-7-phosphate kinase